MIEIWTSDRKFTLPELCVYLESSQETSWKLLAIIQVGFIRKRFRVMWIRGLK